MNRVFVVHEPLRYEAGVAKNTMDLTPAREYGELVFLLPAGRDDRPTDPAPAIDRLWEKLDEFSDKDFLLLVGDPALIGYATAIAASANDGRVAVLKWDRNRRRYFVERVTLWTDDEMEFAS